MNAALADAAEKLAREIERRARPWQRAVDAVLRIGKLDLPPAEAANAADGLRGLRKIMLAEKNKDVIEIEKLAAGIEDDERKLIAVKRHG